MSAACPCIWSSSHSIRCLQQPVAKLEGEFVSICAGPATYVCSTRVNVHGPRNVAQQAYTQLRACTSVTTYKTVQTAPGGHHLLLRATNLTVCPSSASTWRATRWYAHDCALDQRVIVTCPLCEVLCDSRPARTSTHLVDEHEMVA